MIVTSPAELRKIFGVTHGPTPNYAPRWNLPITERAPIVRLNTAGERRLELATWDYRDGSVTTLKGRPPFYNARGESMGKSEAFAQRRCLLPCDGFYEWLTLNGKKQPFLFCREDRQPFAMGGVWSEWNNPDGGAELTYVELTVAPGELVKPIHTRMPLIIDAENWSAFLEADANEARRLIRTNDMPEFIRYPVSTKLNSVKHDGPEPIESVQPPSPDRLLL